MADGSKKPIEDVRTGDKVLATDPKTGETKPQPVAATIIGKGDKTLVTVTIRTTTERAPTTLTTPPPDGSVPVDATQLAPDDEDGDTTSTIVATDGHPFWVPELNTWLDSRPAPAGPVAPHLGRHLGPDHRGLQHHPARDRPQPDGGGRPYVPCGRRRYLSTRSQLLHSG